MGSAKPLIRCVAAVVHDPSGRLLLVQRANNPGAGLWSLPGGKVEAGESDAEAVVRELREETGLAVEPGELVGTVTRGPYEIYDYACHAAPGPLAAGDDAAAARWVSLAEYTALDRGGNLVEGLTATLRDWGALPRT